MPRVRGYFFRSREPSSTGATNHINVCVQIPSDRDLEQMRQMVAGGAEDQFTRISHMVQLVNTAKNTYSGLSVIDTERHHLPDYWHSLFSAIRQGNTVLALDLFHHISLRDELKHALCKVHTERYLSDLIKYCAQASQQPISLDEFDLRITSGAFEVIINDLAATLTHRGKVHFSFGLPTHHAFTLNGSGFCLIDKTAILINHAVDTAQEPLKFIIVGTDVNRDNGLNHNLMASANALDACHIDIFDSRVYPRDDAERINDILGVKGVKVEDQIKCWTHGLLCYFAVDLNTTVRKNNSIHPALYFALKKMNEHIDAAKAEGKKVMIFLPSGWDSHQDETAYCGKYVIDHWMKKEEVEKKRFNDADLEFFYEQVFELYNENKEHIKGIYWGLEGGYERSMYERQIQLLMSVVNRTLVQPDLNFSPLSP